MYYIESTVRSRQWIKTVVTILLLCTFLTHTGALSSCSYGYSEDKEAPNNTIILVHNSGIPLEVICTLRSVSTKTEELFNSHDEPKPEPYTRIAFFNFTKRIDSKYVSRVSSMTAKLEIPNPPLYLGKIYCVLLLDEFERESRYNYGLLTTYPWYMPPIYPGSGVFICTNDLFVISLEKKDLKISVVGINDTIIDINLKLPRVVYDDPYFVVKYYIQFEAQSQTIMNNPRFQLENLKTNETYYISVKLCNIIHIKAFCTDYTAPIQVRTGLRIMTARMDPMKNSARTGVAVPSSVKLIRYNNPEYNGNRTIFFGGTNNNINN